MVKDELIDQVRITVIATGFDETRAKLASMTKPAVPPIQGVVSEPPLIREPEEDEEEARLETGEEEETPEDVFGEKFEIPAFLRKH